MLKRLAVSLVCLAGLAAVVPGGPALEAQSSCTIQAQNRYVRDVLFEYYYWYRELPSLNPNLFASPQAYLEAARYKPLDTTYSFITTRAEQDALLTASQFVGLGLSTQFDGVEMRLSQVFPDSPASDVGLLRGDRILRINGRTIAELSAADELGTIFGANTVGVEVMLEWRPAAAPPESASRKATLVKRVVTIPTVSLTKLYEVDGRKIGYIVFRNFVEPSVAALDDAFTALRNAGATELVLDLRYNGGGLVDVAQHLTSLIGGEHTAGQVFADFVPNDKHRELGRQLKFDARPNALNLQRLVVITTRASASASELVINGLRPYIPVVIVGDRTYGKPVAQIGFTFCDKVVNPVAFVLKNARGEADYFDGLPPTCPAGDQIDRQLGDPEEASLKEAFVYLRTGACTPPPAPPPPEPPTTAGLRATRTVIQPSDGWQQLLGAQ
jgi:carboxyl-terminal processing protease